MKCMQCKEDVPPKFTHAISVNICPLCGKEIMSVKLKNILADLKIALSDAQDHMEEVSDWLLSNYGLRQLKQTEVVVEESELIALRDRARKPDPNSFTNKQGASVRRSDNDDGDEVSVDNSNATVFAKRAGVPINSKKALDFIRGKGSSSGAADPSEFVGEDDEYGDINAPENNPPLPMNRRDQNQLEGIFDNNADKILEMEKLKRLHQSNALGAAPKVNRS